MCRTTSFDTSALDGVDGRCRHRDRKRAREQVKALALEFCRCEPAPRPEFSLGVLFDMYLAEVTPAKGVSKREHDQRGADVFGRYLGHERRAQTLSRRDWDRFIADRRAGRVRPKGVEQPRAAGERVIGYDLKFLLAVLNWATLAGDGEGGTLLRGNPLKGLPLPAEESPRRVTVTAEEYQALRMVAPRVHADFDCVLVLAHETGHRLSALRQLRRSDIDLQRRAVTWRAASDKIGFEHTTPLTDTALRALAGHRRRANAIGDAWVFPSDESPSVLRPRTTFAKWWSEAEKLAELPRVRGRGYHSLAPVRHGHEGHGRHLLWSRRSRLPTHCCSVRTPVPIAELGAELYSTPLDPEAPGRRPC
jgi:integrase